MVAVSPETILISLMQPPALPDLQAEPIADIPAPPTPEPDTNQSPPDVESTPEFIFAESDEIEAPAEPETSVEQPPSFQGTIEEVGTSGSFNGANGDDASHEDTDTYVADSESGAGNTEEAAAVEDPDPDLDAILTEYRNRVKSAILAHRTYPATARRLGREGEVRVQFNVSASGLVSSVEIISSGGDSSLDNAARDAVMSASPVAPIPEELEADSLTLSILIVFQLN